MQQDGPFGVNFHALKTICSEIHDVAGIATETALHYIDTRADTQGRQVQAGGQGKELIVNDRYPQTSSTLSQYRKKMG